MTAPRLPDAKPRASGDPRAVARRVLARVADGGYATLTLHGELDRAGLDPRDRALCAELVYGALRMRLRLDRALDACATSGRLRVDDTVRDALRLAAYQLLFTRVPAHAAVNDAVTAVKRLRGPGLGGLVNALLHRLSREGEPPLPQGPEGLALRHSLPDWAVADARRRFDEDETERYCAALNQPPPLWLRLNLLRGPRDEVLQRAREAAAAPLHPSERLPEAVRAEGLALSGGSLGAGLFTVQDLAAQLVSRLLTSGVTLPPGAALLDACAGVGGKSTHLLALTGDRHDVDAADLSPRKLELTRDLAHRLGARRLTTHALDLTAGPPKAGPLRPAYAAVVLDAPCSGLGVLRRHPEARWRDPRARIPELVPLQAQLLRAVAPRVAKGGHLVYSLCTYTDEEGPNQVRAFLKDMPEFRVAPPTSDPIFHGLLDEDGALRTWPHRDDADAFYAVRLRRDG